MNRLPTVLQKDIWDHVHGDRAYWKTRFDHAVDEFEAHIPHAQQYLYCMNGSKVSRLLFTVKDTTGQHRNSLRSWVGSDEKFNRTIAARKRERQRSLNLLQVHSLYYESHDERRQVLNEIIERLTTCSRH
jgi:hypothetical protein